MKIIIPLDGASPSDIEELKNHLIKEFWAFEEKD